MLLFAGTYRSFVCGLHASGGQSLPPPMLGQNPPPCEAPGRFDSSTVGLPVFASIDVKTLLFEKGKAWRNFSCPRSRSRIQRYPLRPAWVAVLTSLPSISVSISSGADTSSQSHESCGVYW